MSDSTELQDRDLALVEATTTVKGSAALHGIAGAVAGLAGIQFVTSGSYFLETALNALPWGLAALGAIQVGLALLVLKNHYPAAIGACLNAALLALGALAWVVLSVGSGMLSFLALGAVPTTAAAAILAPFTLAQVRRGWAAKKRLQDSGMELGL